jgi:hypothetical protein
MSRNRHLGHVLLFLVISGLALPAAGQIYVGDGGVGYIDSAIPGDQIRLRYESGFDLAKSNRSEFLWAWPQPIGAGPQLDENSIDYNSTVLDLFFVYVQWS